MTAQYFLPCSCGQKVRVEPAQAGGQVACSCGKTVQVPTLRGLKQLEVAPPDAAALRRAAGRRWSPVQGAMFSIGLVVTIISLLVLAVTYLQFAEATTYTQDQTSVINQLEAEQIDSMNIVDSLQAFYSLRDEGLGEQIEPFWITARRIVSQKRTMMISFAGLAAAGLIAAIASLFMKPAKSV
jgi:hypothetical protein